MLEEERLKEEQEIKKFKEKVSEKIPGIDALKMDEEKWNKLRKNIGDKKILTSAALFQQLSILFNKNPENLQAILTNKKSLFREAKLKTLFSAPKKSLKRSWSSHSDLMDENPVLFEKKEESSAYDSPIRKMGVRVEQLQPATPVKGYSEVKRTLENIKVYPVYTNPKGTLYKQLTPEHQKVKFKDDAEKNKATFKPRALFKEPPGPTSYLATRALYKERQGSKRRCPEKKITGMTCLEVFKDHSADNLLELRGQSYHWSHLVAHFLGGQQSIDNLVPSTASANYNVLELVEQYIATKFDEYKATQVQMDIKPFYCGNSLIPYQIDFVLTWDEGGKTHNEVVTIKPDSFARVSPQARKAIDFLREADELEVSVPPKIKC